MSAARPASDAPAPREPGAHRSAGCSRAQAAPRCSARWRHRSAARPGRRGCEEGRRDARRHRRRRARPTTSTPRSSTAPRRRRAGRSTTRRSGGRRHVRPAQLAVDAASQRGGGRVDGAAQAGSQVPQRQDRNGGATSSSRSSGLLKPDRRDRGRAARRARHEASEVARRAHGASSGQAPDCLLRPILSDIVYIVPIGYSPKKPVSTGPWKLISYSRASRPCSSRSRTTGASGEARPAPDGRAPRRLGARQRAALRAGRRDQPGAVRAGPRAAGQRNLQTVVSPTAAWNPITMRVDTAPFNDVRVRQAIRLVMDREQASTRRSSAGHPGLDYYGRFDPAAGTGLKRTPDIERRSRCSRGRKSASRSSS